MKTNYQAYPYPVLTEQSSEVADYPNCTFEYKHSCNNDQDNEILRVKYECGIVPEESSANNDIVALIERGDAQYALDISCSQTYFNKCILLDSNKGLLELCATDLHGRVDLTPMIVATENVDGFSSAAFHEEYGGQAFNLEPGNILASGESRTIYVSFEERSLSSVVTVEEKPALDGFTYEVEINDELICIKLSKKLNAVWHKSGNVSHNKKLLKMAIIKDCVLAALDELVRNKSARDGRWGMALMSNAAINLPDPPDDNSSYANRDYFNNLNSLAQELVHKMGPERGPGKYLAGIEQE